VGNPLDDDGTSAYINPQISANSESMIITASDNAGGITSWSAEGPDSQWVETQVVAGSRTVNDGTPTVTFTPTSAAVSSVNWDNGYLLAWSQPLGSSTWTKRAVAMS
jgi:hypothetical protein